MKKLSFVLSALLFAATTAFGATLTENIDKTFDVKPGAEVRLTNVNGGITITAWDQPRVRVVAEKQVKGSRDDAQEALKELRVEIQPQGGGLVINTRYPKDNEGIASLFSWLSGDRVNAQVRYQLMVPRSMNLDITNTNGAIRVTDVNGRLELETTNGAIATDRCAGSLDASTTNGAIDAELTSVTRGAELTASTTNGAISIAVPRTFAAQVDAATTNGRISSDLPVTTTRIGDNTLRGTINGGGAAMKLRTTNGRIAITTIN